MLGSAATPLALSFADGRAICETCVVADNPFTRLRGLLGRPALGAGEGLLLRPSPSIHTWFMRFAIDVVFLDEELRVLRVTKAVKPWRFAGCRGAGAVLELASGEASARGVGVGDRLELHDGH
jgi:uncharacterized membrane protein (UPF0127 family)